VNVLRKFAEDTSSSMAEMEVAIKQVEIIAMDSMNLSIEVSKNSQDGMDVVQRNIDIMQDIKETVFSSVQVIERLGKRSEEIGEILNVINDVGEQTNLLALNAAIIAAQAGEHGKGFAVVADEIRDLSERTANSTKEIANLIKALQDEASNAVKSMRMGSENVEKGFEQSRLTGEALRKINESASRSTDMAKEIAKATKEQTEGSKLVTREVEKVTEMILQINRATEEQTKSSELIMRAVNDMRNLTKQVKKAMVEQSLGSKQIAKAVENVTDMTDSINKATQEQKTNSEEIQKVISTLGNSVDLNAKNINIMDNALKELKRQASILRDAISKFKV
jgi:methyl-accepting chemotaxis protein